MQQRARQSPDEKFGSRHCIAVVVVVEYSLSVTDGFFHNFFEVRFDPCDYELLVIFAVF